MASDIRFNDDTVIVEGNLGLGTDSPKRIIHTEGGEVHSGGAAGGFSFSDRTKTGVVDNPSNGERWVWYAHGGSARLWSGSDAVSLRRDGSNGFAFDVAGPLKAKTVTTDSAMVNGNVKAAGANVSGSISAASANVSGSISAAGANVSGSISAASANVSGSISAASVSLTGPLHASGAFFKGGMSAASMAADRVDAKEVRVERVMRAKEVAAELVVGSKLHHCSISGQLTGEDTGDGIHGLLCRTHALALNDPAAPTHMPSTADQIVATPSIKGRVIDDPDPEPDPFPLPQVPIPPRLALYHDYGDDHDVLVLNHGGRYFNGVRVASNLVVDGAVTEVSSIAFKDDVNELDVEAAVTALEELRPVTYRYRADSHGQQHLGFIAEEVPDLVAQPGRDRLRPMDIVAVLTAVVQQQQRTIVELAADVATLRAGEVGS